MTPQTVLSSVDSKRRKVQRAIWFAAVVRYQRSLSMFRLKRVLCFLLTSLAFLTVGVTSAAAAVEDPFGGASAAFDAPPDEQVAVELGDWGVAEQRGAVTYTYGITMPPGRNGLEPELALRYSSRSPLRGGVAAGWMLDVPSITVDRSLGYESEGALSCLARFCLGAARRGSRVGAGRLEGVPRRGRRIVHALSQDPVEARYEHVDCADHRRRQALLRTGLVSRRRARSLADLAPGRRARQHGEVLLDDDVVRPLCGLQPGADGVHVERGRRPGRAARRPSCPTARRRRATAQPGLSAPLRTATARSCSRGPGR